MFYTSLKVNIKDESVVVYDVIDDHYASLPFKYLPPSIEETSTIKLNSSSDYKRIK